MLCPLLPLTSTDMTDSGREPRTQRGAAAVEFAFVFPVLFLLIYGVIVYSYIFVLQESINYAAQQAAEAAVAVEPNTAGFCWLGGPRAGGPGGRVLAGAAPPADGGRVGGEPGQGLNEARD